MFVNILEMPIKNEKFQKIELLEYCQVKLSLCKIIRIGLSTCTSKVQVSTLKYENVDTNQCY